MKFLTHLAALAVTVAATADSNLTAAQSSIILPAAFKPPQVFKNTNLVRTVNLDKGYVKETINVAVENTDSKPQDEYYLPFDLETFSKIGSFEVKDRKDESKPPFKVEEIQYDPTSPTQFYRVTFSPPLAPGEQQTLSISFAVLHSLVPLPAKIGLDEKQYLTSSFSAWFLSAYPTLKQKLRVKLPSTDIPSYTILPAGSVSSENKEDPVKQGTSLTYGPFGEVPAGAKQPVSVRYEFTKPVIHASLLERDIEVSHWGGNLATEERYWLENQAAGLKDNFDRVKWTASQYYNPPVAAIKELHVPLQPGAVNPYFIDDIGNVSTSRFRPGGGKKEGLLALKPRYPVFGDWKYSFKVGWDLDLATALRNVRGDSYVLKVPFLECPRGAEGLSIGRVQLRVILPEGATNVNFETSVPLASNGTGLYKTYMDTSGRTALTLTAVNVVDELRDRELLVTYDYSTAAALRKPLTAFAGAFAVFAGAWVLGNLDLSIGRKA